VCDGDSDCSDSSDEANCDLDVPDCEDDVLVTSAGTGVQTTPSTDESLGGWLASLLELFEQGQQGDATETSTEASGDDDDDDEYDDDDGSSESSGSGDDQDEPTTSRPRPRTQKPKWSRITTRPSLTPSPKTVKPEVNENDVLDFLDALSRFDGNRVRVKRAADSSAVGQERRRRCKVSKRQHKTFP